MCPLLWQDSKMFGEPDDENSVVETCSPLLYQIITENLLVCY